MKIKFRPEVDELIRTRFKEDNPNARNKDWITITINNSSQSYCRLFLEPKWIEVSEKKHNGVYHILEPHYLSQYVINEAHVMPYSQFEITIEDELF